MATALIMLPTSVWGGIRQSLNPRSFVPLVQLVFACRTQGSATIFRRVSRRSILQSPVFVGILMYRVIVSGLGVMHRSCF